MLPLGRQPGVDVDQEQILHKEGLVAQSPRKIVMKVVPRKASSKERVLVVALIMALI